MRVISGRLKGRNINGYNIKGTRPTMDRVKESVFAIIQNSIQDSVVLDLFCGSGSYGIEAISNGSKYAYFVDNNKEVINILNKNVTNLGIDNNSKILQLDYKKALLYFKNNNIKFDLIFIDPPYNYLVIEEVINIIYEYNLLTDNGLLVLEYQKDILKDNYNNFNLIREKKYSDKYIRIYCKEI